jgi:hypothetical protein
MESDAYLVYSVIAWLIIVIIGVILGIKQKLVVFRNYNDLGLVFLIPLSIIAMVYFLPYLPKDHNNIGLLFGFIVESILIIYVIIRTIRDNHNPFLCLIAIITKISLSVLFIINFLDFVAAQGKTMSERATVRHKALVVFLIVAPLVFALVKTKEGIFNPQRTMAYRGLGV